MGTTHFTVHWWIPLSLSCFYSLPFIFLFHYVCSFACLFVRLLVSPLVSSFVCPSCSTPFPSPLASLVSARAFPFVCFDITISPLLSFPVPPDGPSTPTLHPVPLIQPAHSPSTPASLDTSIHFARQIFLPL